MRLILVASFVISISISLFTGCSHAPKPVSDIVWPPAPQEPKIVYETSIYGDRDLNRSFFGKIKDFFFGHSESRSLSKPYGIAYDGDSKLYVVDTARKGILVFDFSSGTTRFFNSVGRYGTLVEPVYIILDSDGHIYVSDTELKAVAVFDHDYRFERFIGTDGDFEAPVGMAFDSDESRLYVVDTRQHDVKIFSKAGDLLGRFGGRGDEQGQFHYPLTIAINGDGTIYVIDSFHFAIQVFDMDGNYLFSFGPTPVGMGSMARPRDIAITQEGNLLVTDAMRNNIQIYNRQGDLLLTFGNAGTMPGEFRLPAGITIDKNGKVYIADSVNDRVQIFRYLADNGQ